MVAPICKQMMTPIAMSTTSAEGSPSPSPVAPNAPKFGTLVPNRIFVGGISASTTEAELHALFSNYGNVKATKIISDRAGVSKGYGFVTFETEEEARRIQKEADNIVLKDRKLNIAPAIKKQPFTRVYDPAQVVPNGTILYHNGIPYTYHNGMAFFTTPETVCQFPAAQAAAAAATYPVIYPQPIYVTQQQYQYQAANHNLPAQYMYMPPTAGSNTGGSSIPTSSGSADIFPYGGPVPVPPPAPAPAVTTGPHPVTYTLNVPISVEYSDTAHIESSPNEGNKMQYSTKSNNGMSNNYSGSPHKSYPSNSSYRAPRINTPASMYMAGAGDASSTRLFKHVQGQQPHLVAKTVNGVTVMAYPTPLVFGTPGSMPQLSKDHSSGDHEAINVSTSWEDTKLE